MPDRDVNIEELFRRGIDKLQLEIEDDSIGKLIKYYHELIHWSRKINLIGKKQSAQEVVERHFLDSLLLSHSFDSSYSTLADIGSGAGFPGLVCKIARPQVHLVLVEPRLKRVSFLRHIVRELQLPSVDIHPARVEELAKQKASYTHITSRAVAEIIEFFQMIEELIQPNCRIICMKGPKWKEEMAKASAYMNEKKLVVEKSEEYVLPFSGSKRAILTFYQEKSR